MSSEPHAVRPRPGLGSGLFAARRFLKGEFVVEYTGERIPTSYADTLSSRYLFEVDDAWTIDAGEERHKGRFVNHSCAPNCEASALGGRIFIHAARAIAAGEELTIDYGDEYFDEFIRPVGCKCPRCIVSS